MSKSHFEDLTFHFSSTPLQLNQNLFPLFSRHINLKSYNPTIHFQQYLPIESFRSFVTVVPTRSNPSPSYQIELSTRSSWIILIISLQGKVNIAFIDLKTYKLIKIVRMEIYSSNCSAYSQVDESGSGSFLYILDDGFKLHKFDLESVFNFSPTTFYITSPKPLWTISLKKVNQAEGLKNNSLNIVKVGDKYTLMLFDGSQFLYYSTIDGSLIKIDSEVVQLNIKSIQSGIMLSESDRIIFLNNLNVLDGIEHFENYSQSQT